MTRLLVTGCSLILSSLGWYAGAPFGVFAAFMVSIVGTGAGVYAGRRLANHWGL